MDQNIFLGIFQNYLIFIPAKKYIKCFSVTTRIESWKSNTMSEESSENITKSDSNFAPTFVNHHSLPDMNFNGQRLIKNNIYIPKKVINLYFSYTLGPQLKKLNTGFINRFTDLQILFKNLFIGYGKMSSFLELI